MRRMLLAIRRARALVHRQQLDTDLAEEISHHLEMRAKALEDAGMNPREALGEARRQFGNAAAVREEAREIWSFRPLDSVALDLRLGLRQVRRSPGVTLVAVLSLALGIGSAAAVFNVADAVLLRQLSVASAEQLRAFHGVVRMGAATKELSGVDPEAFAALQRHATFGELFGFRSTSAPVTTSIAEPRSLGIEFVSRQYFEGLRLRVSPGRPLSPADEHVVPIPVVISSRLWRADWNEAPGVLGSTIDVNGHPALVVGVVNGFRGLLADHPADLFVPLSAATRVDPTLDRSNIRVVVRLHDGVTPTAGEEQFAALYMGAGPSMLRSGELRVDLADARRGLSDSRESLRRPLVVGLGLVGALLLVACANATALMLSRGLARRAEFGIRLAIGAGRARLTRQLAVETSLISATAAVLGLIAGAVAAPVLLDSVARNASVSFELRIDWRLVGFTTVTSLASAVLIGGLTAMRLTRTDPAALLQGGERTAGEKPSRTIQTLITVQVACALLLMIGAVSMGRTLWNLAQVDPGYDLDDTMIVRLDATGLVETARAAAYHQAVREAVVQASGVTSATFAQVGPLSSSATTGTVEVAGYQPSQDEDRWTRMFFVGPAYFETMRIPILAGRALTAGDDGTGQRVAVVNQQFAKFYFGTIDSAIGQIVNRDVRIVGVAADGKYSSLRDESPRAMFVPHAPVRRTAMTHIVRVSGDPRSAAAAVRTAITRFDPRLRPVIAAAADLRAAALSKERFFALIATVLSVLALLLATSGLYAAVAHSVVIRRGELAIRAALGGSHMHITALVLRQPVRMVMAGTLAGLPAAYLMLRSARSLLFAVSPLDPLVVAVSSAALLLTALLAASLAARRVGQIDPVEILRNG